MPLSAWAFAFASAFLFGLSLNLAQLGLRHLPAALGAVVSIPTAATLFWLSSPFTADFTGWRWDAVAVFALTGLFYPAAVTIITFEATKRLGPNVTSALGNLAPLYAVAAGLVLLGEAMGLKQLAGVGIIVAGVTLITTNRSLGGGQSWPLWALSLPLAASLFRGLGHPALKAGFALWNNPRVATLICYLMSASVAITVGLLRTRGTAARFSPLGIAWFMLVGVGNGVATWAGIEAVARGPVSLVAPVVATAPLFTLAIGRVMLRSVAVSWQQAVGIALAVAGVVLLVAG